MSEGTTSPPPEARTASPESAEDRPLLEGASTGRLIAVLVMIALYSEVVPFQYSMAGVITPLVGRSFPSAGDSLNWSVTIIGLIGGATMGLLTKMADLWGKKRMLMLASLVFLAGSLICALTTSWALFLVGRGGQAIALGMAALSYSLVRDIMPRRWMPVSVGVLGGGLGVSAVVGPLIGGQLTEHYSWRSIFWFLVVYLAVSIPLFFLIVPETKRRVQQRLDVLGALLFGLGVAGVLIYISQGQSWGWTKPSCYAYLVGGLILLGLFVGWQFRVREPLMDLKLLLSPRLLTILGIAFFGTAALSTLLYVVSYMFLTPGDQVRQGIVAAAAQKAHLPHAVIEKAITFQGDISYAKGFSLWEMALHIALWTSIAAVISGPLGGLWTRRSDARKPLLAAAVLIIASSAVLVVWHDTWQSQALLGIVVGVSFGLFNAGQPNLIIESVPPEQQGISAGVVGALGGIGTSFATAVMTAILIRHPFKVVMASPTGHKTATAIPQVYTSDGFGQVYLIVCLGSGLIALLLILLLWLQRGSYAARAAK